MFSKSSLLIRKQSEVIRNKGVVFKIVVDSVVLYSYMWSRQDKRWGDEGKGAWIIKSNGTTLKSLTTYVCNIIIFYEKMENLECGNCAKF